MNPLDGKDNKIAGFIFKAQVLQENINKQLTPPMQSSELSLESISKKVSLDFLDKDLVDNSRKMSAVYIAISAFENMLRKIISEMLLSQKGENWWSSDSISNDIRKRAETKQADEKQNRWHNPRGLNPIYFTELKDLVSIICNEKNWTFFVDLCGDPD